VRKREREGERGRGRFVIFNFKGMTGVLAPFSYLVRKSETVSVFSWTPHRHNHPLQGLHHQAVPGVPRHR